MSLEAEFIVGIDLGTTNSIVAYTAANIKRGEQPKIQVLEIPQLIAPGSLANRHTLPSFILMPASHETDRQAFAMPWKEGNTFPVGEYARTRGAEIPEHLIASAKSWLCQEHVDRNQPILPWNAPEGIQRISPVAASARILEHIHCAWNHVMGAADPSHRLENQLVYLTVPASFDAAARDLTVKAAELAGLKHVTLLEEPQAAFYAWIESAGDEWREKIRPGDCILVCDVGGGTSDFSLIMAAEENGNLTLERIAVGDHLLVGGDNMDLALAYAVAQQLRQQGMRLDSWQMRGLCQSCRTAKEMLLSDPSQSEYPLTILGRGSSLIGGTIKTKLSIETITATILDGFFPRCEAAALPRHGQRSGLQELGLIYEADPAITRHLAKFVMQRPEKAQYAPTAILFNGGVMKAEAIRQRVRDTMADWVGEQSQASSALRIIEASDYDGAVAKGAAYYGLVRQGNGIRIRGGLGKSYYIGIAAAMPAVPGMPPPIKALCVAPFGMEAGTEAAIPNQEFVLVVGQPVRFDIFSSSTRHEDQLGQMLDTWDEAEILEMTGIETVLEGQAGQTIPVHIEMKTTEIGTLEFWCVSKPDGQRWKLEFNVREKKSLGS